jgi:hypothetical protein
VASTLEILNAARLAFYDNKPTAMLSQTAAQSIPTGSTFSTFVNWDTSTEDNWSGHSNSVNPSRYTCQVAGLYGVAVAVTYSFTGGLLVRALTLMKNGASVTGTGAYTQAYSSNFATVELPKALVRLAVGDIIQASTWQNSGGALNTVTVSSYMSVEYVRA